MTKKRTANRHNAQKSTGPNNTTSTRFNAIKHGLLMVGVTELDDGEGYRTALRDLTHEKDPQGPVEVFLVESAALDMIRLRRARRLEAEYITQSLNPPIHESGVFANLDRLDEGQLVDPGLPATMHSEGVELLVKTYQRYESAIALRLFRTLHELERLQRMRGGENLPAPAAVDVTIHTSVAGGDPSPVPPSNKVLEGSLSEGADSEGLNPGESDKADGAHRLIRRFIPTSLVTSVESSDKNPIEGDESEISEKE